MGAKVENKALEEIDQVKQAIERFRVQNGRYPCPARINLTPDDAGYGQEAKNATDNECFSGADAGYAQSTNIAGDGFARVSPDNNWNSSVLIGAVPFVDLGIDGKFAVDKWGNKYVYAVTEILATDVNGTTPSNLADDAPSGVTIPPSLRGAIQVNDAFSGAIITPYNADANLNRAADFIVLSAGPDGNGAFNKNSKAQQPCLTSGIGSKEAENCDFNDNIFVTSGTLSNIQDDNYFYDLVSWNSSVSNNINVTGSGDFKDRVYIRGKEVPSGFAALRVDGRAEITVGADTSMIGINNNNLRVGRSAANCTVPLGVGEVCPEGQAYSLAVDGRTNLGGNTNITVGGGANNAGNLRVGNNPPATGFSLAVDGKSNLGGNTNITVGGGANNAGNLRVGNNPPATGFSLAVDGKTNLKGDVRVIGTLTADDGPVCMTNCTSTTGSCPAGTAVQNVSISITYTASCSASCPSGSCSSTCTYAPTLTKTCCTPKLCSNGGGGGGGGGGGDGDGGGDPEPVPNWPAGNYCIIQQPSTSCPEGFSVVDPGQSLSGVEGALDGSFVLGGSSSKVESMSFRGAEPGYGRDFTLSVKQWAWCCKGTGGGGGGGGVTPECTGVQTRYNTSIQVWQKCNNGSWKNLSNAEAKQLPCQVVTPNDKVCPLGYKRKTVNLGPGNVVPTDECCPENYAEYVYP